MKKDDNESYGTKIVAAIIVLMLISCSWFGFDGVLSEITGIPELGRLGYWQVFCAVVFFSYFTRKIRPR